MFRNQWLAVISVGIVAVAAGACSSKKGPESVGTGAGAPVSEAALPAGAPTDAGMLGTGTSETSLSFPVVYFDYNQSVIRAESKDPLRNAAEALKANATSSVTIEGHCDERGSSEYNLALGERRAQAVKSYLRTLGVDGKRLSVISYGKERPADPDHTESAWAKNRRAELIVNR
jgi:peptidoglycan-associated lipoprotein